MTIQVQAFKSSFVTVDEKGNRLIWGTETAQEALQAHEEWLKEQEGK